MDYLVHDKKTKRKGTKNVLIQRFLSKAPSQNSTKNCSSCVSSKYTSHNRFYRISKSLLPYFSNFSSLKKHFKRLRVKTERKQTNVCRSVQKVLVIFRMHTGHKMQNFLFPYCCCCWKNTELQQNKSGVRTSP